MNNDKKLITEYAVAKMIIYAEIMKQRGLTDNCLEELENYIELFQTSELGIKYEIKLQQDIPNAIVVYTEDNDNDVKLLVINLKIDYSKKCTDFEFVIPRNNGYRIESYVYTLLESVFSQRCSSCVQPLFELMCLLKNVNIDFKTLKRLYDDEYSHANEIEDNIEHLSRAANSYKYAWFNNLYTLGIKEKTSREFNIALATAYSFVFRLRGMQSANYWSHTELLWITLD